jgi:hypothetical protein
MGAACLDFATLTERSRLRKVPRMVGGIANSPPSSTPAVRYARINRRTRRSDTRAATAAIGLPCGTDGCAMRGEQGRDPANVARYGPRTILRRWRRRAFVQHPAHSRKRPTRSRSISRMRRSPAPLPGGTPGLRRRRPAACSKYARMSRRRKAGRGCTGRRDRQGASGRAE